MKKSGQEQLESPVTYGSKTHINALQSLRGLAALVVLLRHFFICFPIPNRTWNVFTQIILNSHAAVVVFFVLSGFVLFPSFQKTPLTVRTLFGFYIRRNFRILPLLMVVTLLSYLYVRSPLSAVPLAFAGDWLNGLLPHMQGMSALSLFLCMLGMKSTLVPQNWTIMVEVLIAFFLPFMIRVCVKSWFNTLILFLFGLVLSFSLASYGGKSLPVIYAVDFIIGLCAYRVFLERLIRVPTLLMGVSVVGLLCTSSVMALVRGVAVTPFHDPAASLVEAVFAGILILGLAEVNAFSRVLCWKPLVWLGDVSFSVYLVHFLVIVVLSHLFAPFLGGLSETQISLVLIVPVVVVSLVLGKIFYPLIEQRFNQIGRKLQKAVQGSRKV